MQLRIVIASVLAAVSWARHALPCDCMPAPPVERAFAAARVVAVARVAKVEMKTIQDGDSFRSGPVHIRLEVARAWKGAKAGTIVDVVRPAGVSDCDYDLTEGTTHLLYLEPREDGRIDAHAAHCARSRAFDAVDDEMRALDRLAGPPSGPAPENATSGCAGCKTAPSPSRPAGLVAVLAALGMFAVRRRRRGASGLRWLLPGITMEKHRKPARAASKLG